MAFLDDLKENVTDLAQSGVAKAKQLTEIVKLKTANMAEEDTIKKAYVEIGKLYYAEKGDTPEGGYAAACGRITAAKAAIEANNAKIAELKAADGITEAEVEAAQEAEQATASQEQPVQPEGDNGDSDPQA